jgi:hemoglobin-like flavoprotein
MRYRAALDETTHVRSGPTASAIAARRAEVTEDFVNPVEQELVRASFARVAMMPEVAAALFYERLFTISPSFRPLFTHDMRIQGVKLMAMLAIIVYNLHQPGETLSAIRDLAKRHVEYGVKLADYDAVKDALLWTLEQVLAEDLTPEVCNAWAVCYQELADEMKSAAGA